MTCTFFDASVLIETRTAKHLLHWGAIEGARVDSQCIALQQSGSDEFIAVPRRWFATEEDWKLACHLVSTKLPAR
jgi:hypothetical protein